MEFTINSQWENLTVLQFIRKNTCISAGHLRRLKFLPKGILVNGEHATVRKILRYGDILTLATEDTEEDGASIAPVELPLSVLYEDGDCTVPSKPANMPTHPSFGHYDDTVANALAFLAEREGRPFVFRPVNRLDRNTSGLLLIAKSRMAAGVLSDAMYKGKIKKAYIAILYGTLPQDSGYIETYMRRTDESIIVRQVCGENEGGDYALTAYRIICKTDSHTLVAASPITGRTHQLRVHFASLGAPILGDDLYGAPSELISRHALHSALLTFPRVSDGNAITVISPLPYDMEEAVKALFGREYTKEELLSECEPLLHMKKEEI